MPKVKVSLNAKARRALKRRTAAIDLAERRIIAWKENPVDANSAYTERDLERFGARTRVLDLANLDLEKVPGSLRTLSDLENLNLGGNQLRELPPWIGEFKRLRGINLASNALTRLPRQVSGWANLTVLWLGNNQLETLPAYLANLPIRELRLEGNPKLALPESILDRPAAEVLRYYFESRSDDGRPLLELKLLLVGRGKAGKTTIVKRLAGEEPNANESETHSIVIRELTIDCPKGRVDARAWDFGGQEILHSTHQFFLTERSLYLLVLEPRTGLAQRDAEYWLKLVEAQGAGSPVIVILNWTTGRRWRIDDVKLRRKFPFIVDFVSTDALSGRGIDLLREKIVQTVECGLPDVWLPFPKRWRDIKAAVARMHDNYLTYRRYANLCSRFGERRPAAQADLAGILHALGLALYFGKDPRLHDTRVLNPSWVTGGVYAVIRSSVVATNDGQLAVPDMPRILQDAEDQQTIRVVDYPPKTHRFILELMRAFQLCYASEEENGRPSRYLVPELLPEFEPEMKELWTKAPVRLRYRYDILPPGLLPRFIVRTHALSEEAPHWRYGVVLRHAEARALIREETDRSEVHVFVLGGDSETRRVLAAIVRRELETLHGEMKVQPIEELELTGEGERWISVKALREVEQPTTPRQRLPVQPDGTAEVYVSNELDKLVPREARAFERETTSVPVAVRLFVSYAHDDERQLKRLDAILDILEQQHGLTTWRDRRLIAGEGWDERIRERLEDMDIFLFVASQSSLVRPYIADPELRRAKERYAAAEIEVVTVKLEPCACDEDPFLGKLQRLASTYKSVAETQVRSLAWEQVRKDLLPVISRVRLRKARRTNNVFVEPEPKGRPEGSPITHYVLEYPHGARVTDVDYPTQAAAVVEAKKLGHHPLIARVRHTNKGNPDHWRAE